MPLSTVRSKDAISQEGFPLLMELLALAIVSELSSQDSLNVLWIGSKNDSDVSHHEHYGCQRYICGYISSDESTLSRVRAFRRCSSVSEHPVPEFKGRIVLERFHCSPDEGETCFTLTSCTIKEGFNTNRESHSSQLELDHQERQCHD
jgi:hypothetical protein